MKTYLVLGGYGEMGRIASRDLAETARGARIMIAGRDEGKAKKYAGYLGKNLGKKPGKNIIGLAADASKPDELSDMLGENGADALVNCTLYYHNMDVMKACLLAGCHYLDLGGLFHMTRKQLRLDSKFRKKKLIAVLGCGSTPGITNVMAAYGSDKMDRIGAIHVRFAGHSFTKQAGHFAVPYSMYTVFDEFTSKPAVFANGRMKFAKPMSGRAVEYFPEPVGRVVTFHTLHSEIATFPASFKNKGIRNCDFKVSFDEDFVHDVKLMIEAGMASKKYTVISGKRVRPVDVAVKELNRLIPKNENVRDIEYVRVTLVGEKNNRPIEMTIDCLAHSNQKWHASAGDVDTGTPPSIIAQMIAGGKIRQRGVLPPELCVPAVQFFRELAKRGMQIMTTEKRVEFG